MTDTSIKDQLTAAMKQAMKEKQKDRLGVIRMALSAFKQVEVDERIELSDERSLAILDKLVKQRRESAKAYVDAGRQELADTELAEVEILQDFLPAALTEAELESLVSEAIASTGAAGVKDMGKVMAQLKPKLQGRADMGAVSQQVKTRLQ